MECIYRGANGELIRTTHVPNEQGICLNCGIIVDYCKWETWIYEQRHQHGNNRSE